MSAAPRTVGWFWTMKDCPTHYLKNFYQWCYDDLKQAHVYINLGVMATDDFGNMFAVGQS